MNAWVGVVGVLAGVALAGAIQFVADRVRYGRERNAEQRRAAASKAESVHGQLFRQIEDGREVLIRCDRSRLREISEIEWLTKHVLRYKLLRAAVFGAQVQDLELHEVLTARIYRVGLQRENYLAAGGSQTTADQEFPTLETWMEDLADVETKLINTLAIESTIGGCGG